MYNVTWLCPYPISILEPELRVLKKSSGHAASWVVNLSKALAENYNINLTIITHSAHVPCTQVVKKNRITFYVLKYNFPFTTKGFPSYFRLDALTAYCSFVRRAKKIIKKLNPDIIHVHGVESGYALTALGLTNPYIVSIQGIIREYISIEFSFFYLLQSIYEKHAIKKSTYFGCRTDWDSAFVKKINSEAKIYYMPEAINSCFFKKKWNYPEKKSILFVGYISKRKGIEVLLKSFKIILKEHPDIVLNIVGGGDEAYIEKLKNLLTNEENKKVHWLGSRNALEIAESLAESTLFVLPTFLDNSPNSLAEAMAVGTPSISTKVGGVPSMINDGMDGFLVEKEYEKGLASTILRIVDDKNLLNKISENARKRALNRNEAKYVVNETLKVYENVIKINSEQS